MYILLYKYCTCVNSSVMKIEDYELRIQMFCIVMKMYRNFPSTLGLIDITLLYCIWNKLYIFSGNLLALLQKCFLASDHFLCAMLSFRDLLFLKRKLTKSTGCSHYRKLNLQLKMIVLVNQTIFSLFWHFFG